MADKALCSIQGCDKPSKAHALCMSHYMRVRKYGSARPDQPLRQMKRGAAFAEVKRAIAEATSSACWTWIYQRDRHGYGRMYYQGRKPLTHRVVCELAHGAPPTGNHEAAHSCGKGHLGCINPHHLLWKTKAENEADKVAHQTRRNGRLVLTALEVAELKSAFARGAATVASLAERYGIQEGSVGRIIRGKRWANIAASDLE